MIFYYMTYDLSRSTNLPLPSNSQTFEGDLTYFQTGLGACGETNSDSDNIVSVTYHIRRSWQLELERR
jgi:hypothetical protein